MARTIGSLDDLSASVEQAAERKADDRKQEARRRAQDMIEEAEEDAERIHAEILEDARQRAQEKRRQRLTEARQAAMRQRLAAREEILDRVWERAENELRELVEEEAYSQVLNRLARQALQLLGTGQLLLAADPRGHDLLIDERLTAWSEEASEEFDASVEFERAPEPLDAWGGLVASKNEERKRVDARFSERLEIARSEIREAIFERLMGES